MSIKLYIGLNKPFDAKDYANADVDEFLCFAEDKQNAYQQGDYIYSMEVDEYEVESYAYMKDDEGENFPNFIHKEGNKNVLEYKVSTYGEYCKQISLQLEDCPPLGAMTKNELILISKQLVNRKYNEVAHILNKFSHEDDFNFKNMCVNRCYDNGLFVKTKEINGKNIVPSDAKIKKDTSIEWAISANY